MTLPSSGAISLSQVNTELDKSASATISMNDAAVRALFGVASGAISMSQGYGKTNSLTYTISTAQSNANLRTLCNNLGYAGTVTTVIVNINAQISSTSTSTPALEIGSWPAGVTLEINVNAMIVGKGGLGGQSGTTTTKPGSPGGPALKASYAISSGSIKVTINSGGSVRGGGGGGGQGGYQTVVKSTYYGGSGGTGAGPGAATAGVNPSYGGTGGAGGTYGAAGATGQGYTGPGGAGGAAGPATQGSANFSRVGWTSGSTYFGAIT